MSERAPPAWLRCTVRGCGAALVRHERRLACPSGHSFDLAREGYLNLLQPQDRRSPRAGDALEASQARARLWEAGLYDPLLERLAAHSGDARTLADLGSGTGELLGRLAGEREAVGVELAQQAVRSAARRYRSVFWVVANVDHGLPLADGSVEALFSVTGPRNPAESRRALAPEGRLILVTPGAEDLRELREAVQGAAPELVKAEAWIRRLKEGFELVSRESLVVRRRLGGEQLADLARASYRLGRGARASAMAELAELELSLAWELLVLARSR